MKLILINKALGGREVAVRFGIEIGVSASLSPLRSFA